QCIPDTIGCVDELLPGEICPDSLPPGELGVEYSQTVTVWPPGTYDFGEGTVVILMIQIVSIDSLPPGLEYELSAEDLYPDTAYCALISGTPTDTGLYNVVIKVQPYIDFGGNPVMAPVQVNDTSVFIRINAPSNIEDLYKEEFHIITEPNPFISKTRIGCITGIAGEVELYIFDILGKLVYNEKILAGRGENYFDFTGEDLTNGIYIFSVKNNKNTYSRRLVKGR
ncbi:MAG: T9SS type A sorting domain-containing protein, partial [Bacteroidales bacterium]